jgi:aspartate aminotransferase
VSHILDQISLGKIVQIREGLLQAAASGATVYRFESGDPSFSPAPHIIEAINAAAQAGKTHYIPNNGIPELRKALAEKTRRKNGIPDITANDVFVTNGAMHALYVTFGAMLEAGDEVIVPDPMWTEVVENIKLAGGIPVGIPLHARDGFQYRPEAIEAAITDRTVAIFLNTPHNPTGAVLSEATLRAILDIAERKGLWVVSDEAYEDVIYAPETHISAASLVPSGSPLQQRMVTVFSFSKSFAMPGLRLGCLITKSETLHDRVPKLLRCTINGVNSLAQWGAVAAIEGPQDQLPAMRDEYLVRRDIIIEALSGIDGVRPFTPRGAFYVWAELDPSLYKRLGVHDADELSSYLAERGIGSAPGDAFGRSCEDAIRFSFSCGTSMVREGSKVLRAVLRGEAGAADTPARAGKTHAKSAV